MKFAKINTELTVSDQITIEDLKEIQAQGYKTIFCNRPDQESEGQLAFSVIEKEAQNLGIKAIHQPVIIAQFGSSFELAQKPIFAYCRTGTRCSMLWALSHAKILPIDEILSKAQIAGYDLSPIKDRLNLLK